MNPSALWSYADIFGINCALLHPCDTLQWNITNILTLGESVLINLAEESLIAARPDLGSSTSTTTKNPLLGKVHTERFAAL